MAASSLTRDNWVKRLREMLYDYKPDSVTNEDDAISAGTIRFRDEFLANCVNAAVRAYNKRKPLNTKVALTVSDGTLRYNVPTGAVRIDSIRWENASDATDVIEFAFAHEAHNDQILFLDIGLYFNLPSGNTVQVYYAKTHAVMTTPQATTTVPADDEEAVLHYGAAEALVAEVTEITSSARTGTYKYKRGRVTVDNAAGVDDLRKQIDEHRAQFMALTQRPYVSHSAGLPPGCDQAEPNEPATSTVGPFGSEVGEREDYYRWSGVKPPRH